MKWMIVLVLLGKAWAGALCCCSFAMPQDTPSCHQTASCHQSNSGDQDIIRKICDCEAESNEIAAAVPGASGELHIPVFSSISSTTHSSHGKVKAVAQAVALEYGRGHGPPPSPSVLSRFII